MDEKTNLFPGFWLIVWTPAPAPPTKVKAADRGAVATGATPWQHRNSGSVLPCSQLHCFEEQQLPDWRLWHQVHLQCLSVSRPYTSSFKCWVWPDKVYPSLPQLNEMPSIRLTVILSVPCLSAANGTNLLAGNPRSTVAPAPKRGLEVNPAAFNPPDAFRGPWSELIALQGGNYPKERWQRTCTQSSAHSYWLCLSQIWTNAEKSTQKEWSPNQTNSVPFANESHILTNFNKTSTYWVSCSCVRMWHPSPAKKDEKDNKISTYSRILHLKPLSTDSYSWRSAHG